MSIKKCRGARVNRGAIISSTAVSADCKNKDYNRIELNYSKFGCDITIPTRGIFISTNCIEIIKNSVKLEEKEDNGDNDEISEIAEAKRKAKREEKEGRQV